MYEPLKAKRVEASTIVQPHTNKKTESKKWKEVTATKIKTGLQLQKLLCPTGNTPLQQLL